MFVSPKRIFEKMLGFTAMLKILAFFFKNSATARDNVHATTSVRNFMRRRLWSKILLPLMLTF